jgi:hypothetical protein
MPPTSIACRLCAKRVALYRGVCSGCRKMIRERVRRAEVTVEQLVRDGLLLPAKRIDAFGVDRAAPAG